MGCWGWHRASRDLAFRLPQVLVRVESPPDMSFAYSTNILHKQDDLSAKRCIRKKTIVRVMWQNYFALTQNWPSHSPQLLGRRPHYTPPPMVSAVRRLRQLQL